MKVFQNLGRQRGILCFIYLDDILVLGTTPHQVSHSIAYILQTLEDAGMVINYPKSILEPCQEVVHLGFLLHLKGGTQSPLRKNDHLQKGVMKTPHSQRNVLQKDGSYSGAGKILSDSNALFQGLQRRYAPVCISSQKHWVGPDANDTPPTLDKRFESKRFNAPMGGRTFQGMCPVRFLHSDSSDQV